MKRLAWFGLLALAGTANAAAIYSNGPVVGANGLSVLTSPATTFGFGAQTTAGNSMADNFTVGAGDIWNVTSLTFFGYQTGSTAFTFQSATWSIVSGNVNTGAVVASGVTSVTSGGRLGYRVLSTTLGDTARGIYAAEADIVDTSLASGAYWLRWSLTGSLASGPWQPPTSNGVVGNAQQAIANGAFAQAIDAGNGLGVEVPFLINGTITPVPEAGTLAMMLAGGLAVVGAARRRAPR